MGQDLKNALLTIQTMGLGYSLLVRPMLSIMDSEKAHKRALLGLRVCIIHIPWENVVEGIVSPKKVQIEEFGMDFENPLGLAAGMDKKAEAMQGWETLGFGFIEVGGITEHEQTGNPKPRMFRSSKHSALVNRMGFNNPGSKKMASHLSKARKPNVPLVLKRGQI